MPHVSQGLHWMSSSGESLRRLGLVLVLGVLMVGAGAGQKARAQRTQLTLHSESQFWIQGQASTVNFTCTVNQVEGEAALPTTQTALSSSSEERDTKVVVRVPVTAFDCGNSRMTKDLQDALKMEEHPKIRFELVHARVGTPLDTSGTWRKVKVLGTLTIAGTKRLINLEAAGHALDKHRFRVRGCTPIRMTYFNIDPPTKAFGLIKVKNRVEVQFDLLAYAPRETSESPFQVVSVDESPSCPVGE